MCLQLAEQPGEQALVHPSAHIPRQVLTHAFAHVPEHDSVCLVSAVMRGEQAIAIIGSNPTAFLNSSLLVMSLFFISQVLIL